MALSSSCPFENHIRRLAPGEVPGAADGAMSTVVARAIGEASGNDVLVEVCSISSAECERGTEGRRASPVSGLDVSACCGIDAAVVPSDGVGCSLVRVGACS